MRCQLKDLCGNIGNLQLKHFAETGEEILSFDEAAMVSLSFIHVDQILQEAEKRKRNADNTNRN